jgi:hypothetical protein
MSSEAIRWQSEGNPKAIRRQSEGNPMAIRRPSEGHQRTASGNGRL